MPLQIKDVPSILKSLQCHQAPNKIELLSALRSSLASMLQLSKLVQGLGTGSAYQVGVSVGTPFPEEQRNAVLG